MKTENTTVLVHDCNHDIVKVDGKDYLYSVATNPQCQSSTYGTLKHLVSIIYKYGGIARNQFTPAGMECLRDYLTPMGYTLSDLFKD